MTASQPYVAVSRRALDLEDYINVARRHSGWIAGPWFAGLVFSIVVAFCWPNVYESQAVMQITPSQISDTLVQSTINQQLNERIEQMKSNVLSRASLQTMINDPHLNLYKEERNKEPMEDIEDDMRRDIKIQINPEMGLSKHGVSVFTIAFKYRSKKGATDTVNALMSRFIAESTTNLRTQQATVTQFFGDEVAQAKANREKQDETLTKFRIANEGHLPEQEGMNVAQLNSLNNQANVVNQDLNRLDNDHRSLETQITYLENQLKLYQTMTDDAESVTSLPTGIVARQNDELVALNKTIEQEELLLQQLKLKYQETSPDVRKMAGDLRLLQKQRDDLEAKQATQQTEQAATDADKPKVVAKKPTNFRALEAQGSLQGDIARCRTQLRNNETDRDSRMKDKDRLNAEIQKYQVRLAATSAIIAPYQDLLRDNKTAIEKYENYEQKKDLTAQSAELVSRNATETLETLDQPTSPQKPSSPNRPLIIAGGMAASLILGIVLAGVQEARDTSLKNLKDVRAYTNLPVLCSIPLLENTLLVKRKRRIMYLGWSAAVILGIFAVCGAVFYYYTVIVVT